MNGEKTMIRNIVFDMGQVLIRFDPEYFMNCTGIREASDRRIILKELFHSVAHAGHIIEDRFQSVLLKHI